MNIDELQQLQEIERLKKEVLRRMLTKEAVERLGRVRLVNKPLADQLELYLVQLYQAGQLRETIDEEKLKKILSALTQRKKWRLVRR